MNRLFYPAIFHEADEGGYWITFPDFPECMTQGDSISEAYQMAFDALGLALSDMKKAGHVSLPKASTPSDVILGEKEFLVVIEFDMLAYLKRTNSKSIKKTLSIPSWLNTAALEQNINFSQVLQDALMEKMHLL